MKKTGVSLLHRRAPLLMMWSSAIMRVPLIQIGKSQRGLLVSEQIVLWRDPLTIKAVHPLWIVTPCCERVDWSVGIAFIQKWTISMILKNLANKLGCLLEKASRNCLCNHLQLILHVHSNAICKLLESTAIIQEKLIGRNLNLKDQCVYRPKHFYQLSA